MKPMYYKLWLMVITVILMAPGLSLGKTLYRVSVEGVITDTTTGLEWVVGPDLPINYFVAEGWVSSCAIAGGGWRMPTLAELKILYTKGLGTRNMDPAFKTTGWYVWAEPRDASTAWYFSFKADEENWYGRNINNIRHRVFGVRSTKR